MGKLFVIDGTDGSGKQTQFQKLQESLSRDGIDYKVVSFPNYDSPSSALVKMYLSGEFGKNAKEISPYIASTFFAADRYATFKTEYQEYYNNGGIILADRYTTANMVHQAGKISDKEEREKFLQWLWEYEFGMYGLPIPTEVFFLNMPVEKSIELMKNRENKFTHESGQSRFLPAGRRLWQYHGIPGSYPSPHIARPVGWRRNAGRIGWWNLFCPAEYPEYAVLRAQSGCIEIFHRLRCP